MKDTEEEEMYYSKNRVEINEYGLRSIGRAPSFHEDFKGKP